ncbi:hypothetical protein AAU61_04455 [Desulfocarbo indianensis]|nr:hypothetical protein AAU61_04455 [Desulfocarbo indianensis]
MGDSAFSLQILKKNLTMLAAVAPEVSCWLEMAGEAWDASGLPDDLDALADGPVPSPEHQPQTGGITVVVGGGSLHEVRRLMNTMPPGHQVFVLEPRARLLANGLGRHDLTTYLREGDLVILAPHECALEEALSRHPQLALAEQVEFLHLAGDDFDGGAAAVWARLYRVLGQALKARDLALRWEEPRGANLVNNLSQVVFMGRALEIIDACHGRPAVIMEAGESLGPALERLAGRLGGAAVLASDEALPQVLEAGIIPTAVVSTRPVLGRLSCYCHPDLERVPLIAEEVAHAPTLRAHPGPRFLCLGARGTALGPFKPLAQFFTPQHHTLGRQTELAIMLGCKPIVLVGADLTSPSGRLTMPGMSGGMVRAELDQAAAACSLGQVLARAGGTALNTAARGLGLPGARLTGLEAVSELFTPGQPLTLPALSEERWLSLAELSAYARELSAAAGSATRLWQRAAAPLADFPPAQPEEASPWLTAADKLFVALAEQAAADPLQAAYLEGCLVRAFLRRHQLVCKGREHGVSLREACRQLNLCLADLENKGQAMAGGLKQVAASLQELADAAGHGDRRAMAGFARRMGRPETI